MTRSDPALLPPQVEPCRLAESLLGGAPERSRAISAFAAHEPLGRSAVDLLAALRETDGDLGRTLDARADLGDALADAAARLRAYATVKRESRAALDAAVERRAQAERSLRAEVDVWLDQVKALCAELGGATAAFPFGPAGAVDRLRQAHRAQVDRLRAEISRLGSELERTAKEDVRLRSAAEVEARLERHSEIRALLRYLEHGGSGEGVPYLPAAQQIRRRIETAEARIAELEARPDGREVARRAAEIAGLVGDLPAEQDPAAWLGEGVKREIARQQEAVAEEVRRALAYVDVGGDPSPLRCRVQAEAIRRKLCALVGAQVEAEAALAGAREALRNATERADAIREAAVRDAVRVAVSAVRDYDSYSGPMADDVAALAGSHARHAAQIRNLSAETTRLRSYATELEGVAADLRRELAVSRESVAELSDALDRARADLELAARPTFEGTLERRALPDPTPPSFDPSSLQAGARVRRGDGVCGTVHHLDPRRASAFVEWDSGPSRSAPLAELQDATPACAGPEIAAEDAPLESVVLPVGGPCTRATLRYPSGGGWHCVGASALGLAPWPWRARGFERCRVLAVELSADEQREVAAMTTPAAIAWCERRALAPEVLPRAVDWTAAHRPGDLLWDAAAAPAHAFLLIRESGLAQWRCFDGSPVSAAAPVAQVVSAAVGKIAQRAVLVARGVSGLGSAEVLAAWRAAEPAARALVGLPEDGPPEEALPRVVEWRDLEPGDLALDPDYSAIVWRQERGRGTWRYNDGRRGAGAKTPSARGRAILLARRVPKRASAIRDAYERQRAAAEALADEARRVR